MTKPFSDMPTSDCLISNALQLTSLDFHRKVYAMAETYGGLFRVKAPGKTVVVVTDPTLLKQLTSQDFTAVTKPPDLYDTFAILCSDSDPPTYPVLATDNEVKWQTIRAGFSAAFALETVPLYVPILSEEAGRVLHQVGRQTLDVLELAGRISLSATGRVMFGYDAFECTEMDKPNTFWEDLIAARKGAVGVARSPLIKLQRKLCPFSSASLDYKAELKAVHEKYQEIYSQMEAAATAAAVGGGVSPILQAFNSTRDFAHPKTQMTKEDAIAMIGNLVAAGTFPAATAAAYTLCLVACSPDVQARLHDELDAAGLTGSSRSSSSARPFEASDVAKLPYLANVIKEAMRVNPTVPQVNRATKTDIELGGYAVPKGTLLFLSMGGMHTSAHNYLEPHRFYPERWEMKPAAAAPSHAGGTATYIGNSTDVTGSYAPFSTGSRSCLGQHWARLAIMGVVASVLSRFKLMSPRSMTVESLAAGETFSVTAYPRTPLLLTFTPRTAA